MSLSFSPPRQVQIGDAAAFVGTTPRAIRHYHDVGVVPEPERGNDGRRRYGYQDMVRLLWIRKMADVGIALDDIRTAFDGEPGADAEADIAGVLGRLKRTLGAREAELQRQQTALQRMRTRGSRAGLLSEVVTDRLVTLPEGFLRRSDLDGLLVVERIFGPLGAAINATRLLALAARPDLRERGDRVDAAEEALDDTVAVDDPRVAQVAADRHAFERDLEAVIEESGLARDDEALGEAWDADHPDVVPTDHDQAGDGSDEGTRVMSAVGAAGKMPYDFSPARLRCMELVVELSVSEPPAP